MGGNDVDPGDGLFYRRAPEKSSAELDGLVPIK